MRGAVSVALVYAYYDPDGTTTDRARSTLISMTLTVVLISTLVFGAITKPLLDYLLGTQGRKPGTHACILGIFHMTPGPLVISGYTMADFLAALPDSP